MAVKVKYPSVIDETIESQDPNFKESKIDENEDHSDNPEYTHENLSLYSLKRRIEGLPDVARTAEFRYLKDIPYINAEAIRFYSEKASTEDSDAEQRIGYKWKITLPKDIYPYNSEGYSYEDVNYGLMSLEDKFRLDNVWSFAHPSVEVNGEYPEIPRNANNTQYDRYKYFPHHIDEVYGLSDLGKKIIINENGFVASKPEYDENGNSVNNQGNGLMSGEDKDRLDRIYDFMDEMLEKGGKLQEVARTGQFRDLIFGEPIDNGNFYANLNKSTYVATQTQHGFMSREDKAAFDNFIYNGLSGGIRGQILLSTGSGVEWRNDYQYKGKNGVEVNLDKVENGVTTYIIEPTYGLIEQENPNVTGAVAPTYHTHDGWYMHRDKDTDTVGSISAGKGIITDTIRKLTGDTVYVKDSNLSVDGKITGANAVINANTQTNTLTVINGITADSLTTTNPSNTGKVKTNILEADTIKGTNATISNMTVNQTAKVGALQTEGTVTATNNSNTGKVKTNLLEVTHGATINGGLTVDSIKVPGGIDGNASSASKLKPGAKINGTLFDGTGDITTAGWGVNRNFTIADNTNAHSQTTNISGTGDATLRLPTTITASLNGVADKADLIKIGDSYYSASVSGKTLSFTKQ